jgi:diguanylate cyclase (GGDEF)-like protein
LPSLLGRPGSPLTAIGAVVVATVTGEIFARLAERVRRDAKRDAYRTSALEALTAGQVELARATDPAAAAAIASFVARQILDADWAAVLLERDGRRVELGACPAGEGDDLVREGDSELPEVLAPHAAFEVPLSGRDGTGVRGVLAADPRPGGRFDPFGQALAGSLAAATCAALESIALNGRLRVRAEVDPLTGLGNRRRLETAMARLQPGDLVIVLDLDHFKAVNDTLGHDVGDEVLRAFGEHLAALTRAGELAIRTGGEEFVLVAQGGHDPRAGAALLGRLAADWWRTSPLTTFSAGAAVHPGGDTAVTMKRADEALYEAKRRGRAAGWLLAADAPIRRVDQTGLNQAGAAQLSLDLLGGRLIPFPGTPFDARTAGHVILPRQELGTEAGAPVGLTVHRA